MKTDRADAGVVLCCTNKGVDRTNWDHVMKTPSPIVVGDKWPLYLGCRVRMTKNEHKDGGGYVWANQETGTLVGLSGEETQPKDGVQTVAPTGKTIADVELDSGKTISVPLKRDAAGKLPVVCAYARTISSVQGMTHKAISGRLHISYEDWAPSLQPQLPYVGFSRVESPKCLSVSGLSSAQLSPSCMDSKASSM